MTIYMSEPETLNYFVDGLKKAAGAAHALAHAQENPNWLKVRDMLESLIEKGQRLALAKSMPRNEVIRQLDIRQANAPKDSNGN